MSFGGLSISALPIVPCADIYCHILRIKITTNTCSFTRIFRSINKKEVRLSTNGSIAYKERLEVCCLRQACIIRLRKAADKTNANILSLSGR